MEEPQNYLVSFENVSATVGGFDISSIVELQLSAMANDIPTLTLLVDGGNSGIEGSTEVSEPSLEQARIIFDNCRSIVKTSAATLSLSVTARFFGKTGETTQTLAIDGWLLSDVSLSPVQIGGICTVMLTFRHPICRADFGGSVPGLLAKPLVFDDLEGNNPLDVFLSSLRVYGGQASREQPRETDGVEGASDQASIRADLIRRIGKAADALEESVTWKGPGGLPAESHLASWADMIRFGMTQYAMPEGGTSVFQRFARSLVPECSLSLGGDYTKTALELKPFTPWEDATLRIPDSDILSLEFPKNDPSPISGVKMTSNDTRDSYPNSFHIDTSQVESRPADVYYVPTGELEAEFLYGPIHQFREPGWLSHMIAYAGSMRASARSDAIGAQLGTLQTAASTPRLGGAMFHSGSVETPDIDYSSALLACAKAYYETSLMKDWAFSVTSRLLLSSEGEPVCPGRVMSVVSDDAEVIGGYVIGVVHTISVNGRTASTSITCAYPRFGTPPRGITSTGNALYT